MLRVIVFAFFMLVSFNLTAAPAVSFIEFTPIAAISDGYSFEHVSCCILKSCPDMPDKSG